MLTSADVEITLVKTAITDFRSCRLARLCAVLGGLLDRLNRARSLEPGAVIGMGEAHPKLVFEAAVRHPAVVAPEGARHFR